MVSKVTILLMAFYCCASYAYSMLQVFKVASDDESSSDDISTSMIERLLGLSGDTNVASELFPNSCEFFFLFCIAFVAHYIQKDTQLQREG